MLFYEILLGVPREGHLPASLRSNRQGDRIAWGYRGFMRLSFVVLCMLAGRSVDILWSGVVALNRTWSVQEGFGLKDKGSVGLESR